MSEVLRLLAHGCENSARALWRGASEPDHSWEPKRCLQMAERMAFAARALREHIAEIERPSP